MISINFYQMTSDTEYLSMASYTIFKSSFVKQLLRYFAHFFGLFFFSYWALYSEYKPLVRYVIYKYFFSAYTLSFLSLKSVVYTLEILNVNEVDFINLSFIYYAFGLISKTIFF